MKGIPGKLIVLMTATMLLSALLIGCSAEQNGTTAETTKPAATATPQTSVPAATEAPEAVQEITFMVEDYGRDDFTQPLFVFTQFEDLIGIKVTPVPVVKDGYSEKLNTMIAARELPDLISCDINIANLYGPDGLFYDYSGDLDVKMPNVKSMLEQYSGLGLVTMDSGAMYCLPVINTEALNYTQVGVFRKDVMDEIGIAESDIKTVDDVYDYLLAAKGTFDIEYPFQPVDAGLGSIIDQTARYVGAGYAQTPTYDYDAQQFIMAIKSDKYKAFAQFVLDCYQNDLLHPDIFAMTRDEAQEKKNQAQTAFFVYPEMTSLMQYEDEIKTGSGIDTVKLITVWPIEFMGEAAYPSMYSPIDTGSYCKAINADTQVLDAVFKFVDYCYSEEGVEDFYFGEEGTHFEKDEAGNFKMWNILFDWNDDPVPAEKALEWGKSYGLLNIRYVFVRLHMPQSSRTNAVYDQLVESRASDVLPAPPGVLMTQEQTDEYTQLKGVIQTCIQENLPAFMTGQKSMDEWDSFIAELDGLGIDRMVEIYNAAVK